MTTANKAEINWTSIEAGLGAIAFGLILFVIGWQSAILSIFAGFLTILGSGYLLSVPEVRFYFKLVINRVSRKQVFKNTGTISGSNVVGPVDTGGGPLTIQQNADQRKTPFLRAIPKLNYFGVHGVQSNTGFYSFTLFLEITNLGDGIATDIVGQTLIEGSEPLPLPKGGKFEVPPLGSKETTIVDVFSIPGAKLAPQKTFKVTIQFKDISGKNAQSTVLEGTISDLKINNFAQMLGMQKNRG